MPRFDGTGPNGIGPMTGRSMGYCVMALPKSGGNIIPRGYTGIYGIPTSAPYNYNTGIPYSGGMYPYSPPGNSLSGMSFSRGWGRCRGFGHGRDFGRGKIRWF